MTASDPAGRERVAALWGDAAATARLAEIHWMASPVVRAYLNRRVSGDPKIDWLTSLWPRFVRGRMLRVLVLGCGEGWLERTLARRPEVASIDACDVAPAAVAAAADRARAEGLAGKIRYHVVDLDADLLPGGPWEVAIAHSVLHHVRALEHCYAELASRLVPDGLLLVNEYAGPRRFQFTAGQMRIVDGCLTRLPERLRTSAVTGGPYARKDVPDEDTLAATDPSEAVRSDEVLPLLERRFEVLHEYATGGTVLHLLLYDVVQNFDPADPRENRLLALLCLLEESLIDAGALPSDFKVAVARNRRPRSAARADAPSLALLLDTEIRAALRRRRPPPPRALPPEAIYLSGGRGEVAEQPADPSVRNSGEQPASPATRPNRLRIHSRPLRDRRHGLSLPPVRDALHTRVTGWPGSDWTTYALDNYFPGGGPGPTLVLDAPTGWLATRLAADPAMGEVDLLVPLRSADGRLRFEFRAAAPAALDREAVEGTDGAGPPQPPAARYARAFTNGWLGITPDRPALVALLATALRPGGLLIGDDYTGPEHNHTTPASLHHARALLDLLQPPDARPPTRLSRLRDRLIDLDHARHHRRHASTPLPALLAPHFRLLDHRPQLGALLQRVLPAAEPLLDPTDDRDATFLRLLCHYEQLLTDAGVIPSEYTCFAAIRT